MESTTDQATSPIAAGSTSPADPSTSAGSADLTGRIGSGDPSTPTGYSFDATATAAPATAQQTRPKFRLRRSRTDRMLGGVCGGLGESLGVDAAVLRIGFVTLTVLGVGMGVVLYVAVWMLAPETDEP
jgi:phage shock protein C